MTGNGAAYQALARTGQVYAFQPLNKMRTYEVLKTRERRTPFEVFDVNMLRYFLVVHRVEIRNSTVRALTNKVT